jgi:hypothetical protein
MRKLLIITALLLFAGIAFGQTLQKGNLIGLHVLSIDLKPGVTLDQYLDFFNEKVKPAWEKAEKGMKIFSIKGLRGEDMNEVGVLVQYEDEATRNKSFNPDGSPSEFGNKLNEEMAPINSELEKLGTYTSKYTDWIIQ